MTKYEVPSKSEDGVTRTIEEHEGKLLCDCPAHVDDCRHVKGVKALLAGEATDLEIRVIPTGAVDSSTPENN